MQFKVIVFDSAPKLTLFKIFLKNLDFTKITFSSVIFSKDNNLKKIKMARF